MQVSFGWQAQRALTRLNAGVVGLLPVPPNQMEAREGRQVAAPAWEQVAPGYPPGWYHKGGEGSPLSSSLSNLPWRESFHHLSDREYSHFRPNFTMELLPEPQNCPWLVLFFYGQIICLPAIVLSTLQELSPYSSQQPLKYVFFFFFFYCSVIQRMEYQFPPDEGLNPGP